MSELWLKNNKVMTLSDVDGFPAEIVEIHTPELLPMCLFGDWKFTDFEQWLKKRGIPDNREGLDDMIAMFGDKWLRHSNYASLTDQYWLKFSDEETWDNINFFTNEYSYDIGDMAFKPWLVSDRDAIDSHSPDLTTNGLLRKRWVQNKEDKTSCLIKAGSFAARQEPLSEVLVSSLCEQMGIKNAGYDLTIEGSKMCSISKNFITADTELVPLSFFYHHEKRDKAKTTTYDHILHMCDKYEIPGARKYLDEVIFIDYVTRNGDRHLGNIAFIRDINTMKFLGPAPIFDCGQAYWSTKDINEPIKSEMFFDVEKDIFEKVSAGIDIKKILGNRRYENLIQQYPGMTDKKKENLCRAIRDSNCRIVGAKKAHADEAHSH